MGVDTNLFISHRWGVRDICDVITLRFGVPTKIHFHETMPDYLTIQFMIKGGEYERLMHCHTDSHRGGFKGILLSFRSNEEGHMIMRTLAETFGGFFCEQDCDGQWEEIQPPGEGDADFCVNQALKDNPKLGDDTRAMGEYLANERWKELTDKIYRKRTE